MFFENISLVVVNMNNSTKKVGKRNLWFWRKCDFTVLTGKRNFAVFAKIVILRFWHSFGKKKCDFTILAEKHNFTVLTRKRDIWFSGKKIFHGFCGKRDFMVLEIWFYDFGRKMWFCKFVGKTYFYYLILIFYFFLI